MIKADSLQPREQIYSHIDEKTGKRIDIAVDRIRYKYQSRTPILIEVEQMLAMYFMENSGTEVHRIQAMKRLSDEAFAAQVAARPAIVCWCKDEQWLLVDGNHTYAAAWLRGVKHIPALEIRRQEWSPFLVKDYERSLTNFSGIFPESNSGTLTEKVLEDAVLSTGNQSR